MNVQKPCQTNPMAPWDPLDAPIDPLGPPEGPPHPPWIPQHATWPHRPHKKCDDHHNRHTSHDVHHTILPSDFCTVYPRSTYDLTSTFNCRVLCVLRGDGGRGLIKRSVTHSLWNASFPYDGLERAAGRAVETQRGHAGGWSLILRSRLSNCVIILSVIMIKLWFFVTCG